MEEKYMNIHVKLEQGNKIMLSLKHTYFRRMESKITMRKKRDS
jgi:hypothetical protein